MKPNISLIKTALIMLCCLHFMYLIFALFNHRLGENPIEALTHITGEWGLRLLIATLAITPLRRLFHWNSLVHFRRLLGVCSFVYLLAHFLIFLVFDHFFDIASIIEDIIERPYITVGFIAFMGMLPLAITSLSVLQRKMGQYWSQLHRLVYLVAVLAVLHYWWLVKADVLLPAIYAVIVLMLFAVRIYFFAKKKRRLVR